MNLACDFWQFGLSNKLLLWWPYIIFLNFSLCTLWITRIKTHKGRYETFKDVHMTFWSLISPIFTIYFYHMFQAYIWLMLFFKFVLNDQIHLENSRTGKWKLISCHIQWKISMILVWIFSLLVIIVPYFLHMNCVRM